MGFYTWQQKNGQRKQWKITTSKAVLCYAQFLGSLSFGEGGVCGKYFPDTQAWTHEALIYAKFIKSSCRRGWMKGLHCCLPSRMCFSSHPLPKSKADFLNRHKFTHAHTNTHSQKWGGGERSTMPWQNSLSLWEDVVVRTAPAKENYLNYYGI